MALLLHLFVVWRLIQREAAIINCFKGHVLSSRLKHKMKETKKAGFSMLQDVIKHPFFHCRFFLLSHRYFPMHDDTYVHGGCCWRCGLQSNVPRLGRAGCYIPGWPLSPAVYPAHGTRGQPAPVERAESSISPDIKQRRRRYEMVRKFEFLVKWELFSFSHGQWHW